jgi:putative protease
MQGLAAAQIGKHSGQYAFSLAALDAPEGLPFLPAAFLNGIRRQLAEQLDALPVAPLPLRQGQPHQHPAPATPDYRANIANSLTRALYRNRGSATPEDAYELSHRPGVELMRSKYCVRFELGLCPRQRSGNKPDPLFLLNNGRRLRLRFDCPRCEMVVDSPQ